MKKFIFIFIILLGCEQKTSLQKFGERYEQMLHKQDLERKKCLDEAKLKSSDPEKIINFYKICLLERKIPGKR